ncbi:flavodoxin [Qiania dongpingensis]|uniref:Flavodoxin n=1 Tax=Qiania dongpingensis TaxID=2763669 RepID=A0A7G9G3B7_9FIRM|nr:flavodoxin [Qiania dongpingensis]QNM05299.1 flavodoxin [Qiania dongpingensis]
MKKLLALALSVLMLTLSACGNTGTQTLEGPSEESSQINSRISDETQLPEKEESSNTAVTAESTEDASDDPAGEDTGKALVVYFSWSGNTETLAGEIQSQTGADLFELIPEEPYTDDYDTLLDIAQEEQRNDARPAISGSITGWENYEVIYVGYPNWWGDMPMILYSFFDEYDLSGKTIAPFCTSGGSGLSDTINSMRALEPDAVVLDGLHLGSSAASAPGSAVTQWLNGLGLTE